jgi:hypothetical protein
MSAAIRPIALTGVAFVGAAVIVANPIMVPLPDIRIPAVQLSADRVDVLGPAFLATIGATDPVSTNPIGVAQQMVENLINNATDAGEATVAAAFAAGVVAAAEPSLILGSPQGATGDLPTGLYRAVVAATAPLGPSLLIVNAIRTVTEHLAELTNVFPTTLPDIGLATADPTTLLEQLSTNLTEEATEITGAAVAAAFATGAVSVVEPAPILDALTTSASSDDPQGLYGAVLAATAPLGSPAVVVNSVRTVIVERLTELANVTIEPGASQDATVSVPPTGGQDTPEAAVTSQTPEPNSDSELPADDQGQLSAAGAAEGDGADVSAAAPNGATDLTDGNKFVPNTPVPTETNSAGPIGDAVKAIKDQVRLSVEQLRDALRGRTGGGGPGPSAGTPGSDSPPGGGAPGGAGSPGSSG